jgi:hypothetical protein
MTTKDATAAEIHDRIARAHSEGTPHRFTPVSVAGGAETALCAPCFECGFLFQITVHVEVGALVDLTTTDERYDEDTV